MPVLNGRGDWAAGIGGSVITVNGEVAIPFQAGGRQWVREDTVVGQHCDSTRCRVVTWNLHTKQLTEVLDHGANQIEAGGGVWAVWYGPDLRKNPDHGQFAGITTSYGLRLPSSGLGPMGPDGAMAVKVEYLSAGPWDVVEPDGRRWRLTEGDAGYINLLGNGRAVWLERDGRFHARLTPLPSTPISPLFWWSRILDAWHLYQAEDGRLLLQTDGPTGVPEGYVVAPSGNAYRPDLCRLADGRIRVVWAESEEEAPQRVRVRDIALSEPRVILSRIVVPVPPPPPPPPDPKPAPQPQEPPMNVPNRASVLRAFHQSWNGGKPITDEAEKHRFTEALVPVLNREDGSGRWGRKSRANHGGPKSKDTVAYWLGPQVPTVDTDGEVHAFDLISGGSGAVNWSTEAENGNPDYFRTFQMWIPVAAAGTGDSGTGGGTGGGQPEPTPQDRTDEILRRIETLDAHLTATLNRQAAALESLAQSVSLLAAAVEANHDTLSFPSYKGNFAIRSLVSGKVDVTLEPVKK